jgi:protein phosphatase
MIAIAAQLSDPGCKRVRNEDRTFIDTDRGVFVLADGMGGERCGELAAQIAVQVAADCLLESALVSTERLRTAVQQANSKIWEASQARPECSGMGSTISAVLLDGLSAAIANVGDSRVYLYRDNELRRLTRDDAVVSTLLEAGKITPEGARNHPLRNVLTLALGRSKDINVKLVQSTLITGDQLLLSSDGLHGVVAERDIVRVLETASDPATKTQLLVDAARRNGGPDNISCIVAAIIGVGETD